MQYRINYLLATITYFPFTVGFIFEEYMHGDINQTVAGGVSNRSSKKENIKALIPPCSYAATYVLDVAGRSTDWPNSGSRRAVLVDAHD